MSTSAAHPLRVLVVDDNRDFTDSVATLLKLKGHELFVAYDPAEGLRLAYKERPHLIFHDIVFSDSTGYEAARRLRADPTFDKTLLIAVSGVDQPAVVESSKHAGFDRHVTKPISYRVMLEALADAAALQHASPPELNAPGNERADPVSA